MPTLQVVISEANDKLLRERLRRKGDIGRIVNAALDAYFGCEANVNEIVKCEGASEVGQ